MLSYSLFFLAGTVFTSIPAPSESVSHPLHSDPVAVSLYKFVPNSVPVSKFLREAKRAFGHLHLSEAASFGYLNDSAYRNQVDAGIHNPATQITLNLGFSEFPTSLELNALLSEVPLPHPTLNPHIRSPSATIPDLSAYPALNLLEISAPRPSDASMFLSNLSSLSPGSVRAVHFRDFDGNRFIYGIRLHSILGAQAASLEELVITETEFSRLNADMTSLDAFARLKKLVLSVSGVGAPNLLLDLAWATRTRTPVQWSSDICPGIRAMQNLEFLEVHKPGNFDLSCLLVDGRLSNLRHLDLSTCRVSLEAQPGQAALVNLETLILDNLTDGLGREMVGELKDMVSTGGLRNLRTISLNNSDVHNLDWLGGKVDKLHLKNARIRDFAGLQAVAGSLIELNLEGVQVPENFGSTDEGGVGNFVHLKRLNMRGSNIRNIEGLANLRKLEFADFSETRVNARGARILDELQENGALKELRLEGSPLGSERQNAHLVRQTEAVSPCITQ